VNEWRCHHPRRRLALGLSTRRGAIHQCKPRGAAQLPCRDDCDALRLLWRTPQGGRFALTVSRLSSVANIRYNPLFFFLFFFCAFAHRSRTHYAQLSHKTHQQRSAHHHYHHSSAAPDPPGLLASEPRREHRPSPDRISSSSISTSGQRTALRNPTDRPIRLRPAQKEIARARTGSHAPCIFYLRVKRVLSRVPIQPLGPSAGAPPPLSERRSSLGSTAGKVWSPVGRGVRAGAAAAMRLHNRNDV
jgi:hypothetical protein